jgi:hypothetical protein
MQAKTKIRLEAIEQVQRALEALPEYRAEEVTKTQAIRILITQIRATQSKGYSLEAIGNVLSERGIPITAAALRAYVSEARGRSSRKKKKRDTKHTGAASQVSPVDRVVMATDAQPQSTAPEAKRSAAVGTKIPSVDARERPSAVTPVVGRRSVFPIRRDTDDI